MPLQESVRDTPNHWPVTEEIEAAAAAGGLIILPDRIDTAGERRVAAFRGDAQELRVRAKQKGLEAQLLAPADAELAVYSEHAADWVLPVVVSAVLAVPSALVADMLHDRIADAGEAKITMPEVRYREAYVEDGQMRLREIEGPADELLQLLRQRDDHLPVHDTYPGLSPTPPETGSK